ncbi:MAG: MgtC/SapB family protein [Bacilli bacterium]|jgi:putative Mg2+ transporter-C (MgtC) family protein|nr:MgtC/SapB family protein [Bacilli bacterium]
MLGILLEGSTSQMITIDQWIAERLNSWTIGDQFPIGNFVLVICALLLTVLLGTIIGAERETRGRSAGLRTHLLVAVGSSIIMIVSIYGFPLLDPGFARDPARLAAQVITGIGFLGAGAIIHSQGGIKGLTTSSTIWLAMAIGLACGSMNFTLAIIGTTIVMIVLVSFRKVELKLTRNNPLVIIVADAYRPIMTDLLAIAKKHDAVIGDIVTQLVSDIKGERIQITFRLSAKSRQNLDQDSFLKMLKQTAGIIDIQILNHH